MPIFALFFLSIIWLFGLFIKWVFVDFALFCIYTFYYKVFS